MFILLLVSIGFLFIRLLVAGYNLLTNQQLTHRGDDVQSVTATLSILVPARNEENSIGNLLKCLPVDDSFLEIIVLNDGSTDETVQIVQVYQITNPKIKLVNGKPLPQGWLGKNWACHQLAQEAKGQYLLFLDADVVFKPTLFQKLVSHSIHKNATLLSLFPGQYMYTVGEKLTVPIMHYLLLSLLPLDLIYTARASSLAAANGQCMLFEADVYKKYWFHEANKIEVVEDIAIMQLIKKNGLKGITLLGNGLIYCRMYTTYLQGVQGFSKNLLAGFGNSTLGLVVFLGIIIFIPVASLYYTPVWAVAYFTGALLLRVLVSLSCRQSVFQNTIFHLAQMVTLIWIAIQSIYLHKTGKVEWKGRKLKIS